MRVYLMLAVATLLAPSWGFGAEELAAKVKTVLETPRRDMSRFPSQEHAEALRPLGDRVYPALASFLADHNLGYEAASTMVDLDPERAAPYLFEAIPKTEEGVQVFAFEQYVRRIRRGDKVRPSKTIHDAAIRALDSNLKPRPMVVEPALYAIGLSGSPADISVLRKHLLDDSSSSMWRDKMRRAAEAALAKVGDEAAIKSIREKLDAPVPAALNWKQSEDLAYTIDEAVFVNPRMFSQSICRHLNDAIESHPDTDYSPASPSAFAKQTFIALAKDAPKIYSDAGEWSKWQKKHPELCK